MVEPRRGGKCRRDADGGRRTGAQTQTGQLARDNRLQNHLGSWAAINKRTGSLTPVVSPACLCLAAREIATWWVKLASAAHPRPSTAIHSPSAFRPVSGAGDLPWSALTARCGRGALCLGPCVLGQGTVAGTGCCRHFPVPLRPSLLVKLCVHSFVRSTEHGARPSSPTTTAGCCWWNYFQPELRNSARRPPRRSSGRFILHRHHCTLRSMSRGNI